MVQRGGAVIVAGGVHVHAVPGEFSDHLDLGRAGSDVQWCFCGASVYPETEGDVRAVGKEGARRGEVAELDRYEERRPSDGAYHRRVYVRSVTREDGRHVTAIRSGGCQVEGCETLANWGIDVGSS